MITLQLKTNIPPSRHVEISLDLPDTIKPGEAEIVLIVNNIKEKQITQREKNQEIQKKLLGFSIWSEREFSDMEMVREKMNQWKPDEF